MPSETFLEKCRQSSTHAVGGRLKQWSFRIEEASLPVLRRFSKFHGGRTQPRDIGAAEIRTSLSHLALEQDVTASTQNLAFNALKDEAKATACCVATRRTGSKGNPMTQRPERRAQSRGTCAFCRKTAARSRMRRHLETCEARAAAQTRNQRASSGRALHLTVEGVENPAYWLHLEAAPSATLEDLDRYLRRIWLECCGHLSAFEIDGTRYAAVPDDEWGEAEEPMTKRLSRVLRTGQACGYEYDYGSTTRLWVRVWGEVPERSGRERIVLLARNEAPDLPCVDCGRSPTIRACAVCRYETGGWLCAECAPEHECGEDMQLPVVNSPRTGVCGYTGELETENMRNRVEFL